MEFYNQLEEHYDDMIRFKERINKEKIILTKWVNRYKFKSAIDVACGTGLHAILLAEMGVETYGTDLSDNMLEKARLHAAEMKVNVNWLKASMEKLIDSISKKFEAILCLGNSIPHILDKNSLDATCKNFSGLLLPGGIVVIQLINYHRIYSEKNRIIGIHRHGDTEYIRFYDLFPNKVLFNILIIEWLGTRPVYKILTTELYPYRKDELENALKMSGFTDFEYYGDMEFKPFNEEMSPNLIVVCRLG